MSNIKAVAYNGNIIGNYEYDNEDMFGTVMRDIVKTNGRKSIFSMIKDEKSLSIFVMRTYIRNVKVIVEKNVAKNYNDFAFIGFLEYYLDILTDLMLMEMKESEKLPERKENCGITLPAMSADEANTNGVVLTYRSSFNADFNKETSAIIGRGVSIDKMDRLKRFVSVSKDKCVRNNGVSVSIIYIDLTAIAEAMQNVLFIRKIIYSEKLII